MLTLGSTILRNYDISGTQTYSILNYTPKFIILQEFRNKDSHVSMTPFQLERMFTNNVLVNNLVSCHFVMFFFKASHVLYVEISFQLKRISVKTYNQITKREKKN